MHVWWLRTEELVWKKYLEDDVVTVKGPKGEMSQYVNPAINVAIEEGHVVMTENENAMLDNPKQKHGFHGLYRSLVHKDRKSVV